MPYIFCLLTIGSVAQAESPGWSTLATTSGTLVPGSLCTTDGRDITCQTTTGQLSPQDRIASGTTGITANSTGTISLTTNGTTNAYIAASGLLVTLGVSATTGTFHSINISSTETYGRPLIITHNQNGSDGSALIINNGFGASLVLASPWTDANAPSVIKTNNGEDLYFNIGRAANTLNPPFILTSTGRMGIGITTPTTALEVGGTISATGLTTRGTVKVSNTVYATAFVGDGSGLTNLTGLTAEADRIASGTTRITTNSTGTISLTTAGTVTGYFDTAGRLIIPSISTTDVTFARTSTPPAAKCATAADEGRMIMTSQGPYVCLLR